MTAQRDFACHREIGAHRLVPEGREQRKRHRGAGTRPVLRNCPGRNVQVKVVLAEVAARRAALYRKLPCNHERQFRRLPHHGAHLPGRPEEPSADIDLDFDRECHAARRGVREPVCHADFVPPVTPFCRKARLTEVVLEISRRNREALPLL